MSSLPRRSFDENVKNQCWEKAEIVPGRDPSRWRKDIFGNIVCKLLDNCDDNCHGLFSYEYDHVIPDGESTAHNCQIVRTLKKNSEFADHKFTDSQIDSVEYVIYGDVKVKRPVKPERKQWKPSFGAFFRMFRMCDAVVRKRIAHM